MLDQAVKNSKGFKGVVSQKSFKAEKVSNTWTNIVLFWCQKNSDQPKIWPVSFKWHEIWVCESYNSEQLSFSVVVLGKQSNTPDSTGTIKKFHWWWRIHVNKWIDCDRFCDDRVNKWGPTTTTGFAEAEERARHRAKKWSGTIRKRRDLGLFNASLHLGHRLLRAQKASKAHSFDRV